MSANLYDLLDVDETATVDEIRAAWKSAIADLDPGDRRFRAFNDAAGVLLDAERRAAYDAELAAQRDAEEEPALEPVVVAVAEDEDTDEADAELAAVSLDKPGKAEKSVKADEPDGADEPAVRGPRGAPAGWMLGAAGAAAALALALAVVVSLLPGTWDDPSPRAAAAQAVAGERAGIEAQAAAEQMVAPVLSYNHQTMGADLERAKDYLTDQMAAKQTKAWPDLTKEAEAQQIVVEATAPATALTRVSPDGKRATVVVFIDQAVTKKGAAPFTLNMWATFQMVRSARGPQGWLLDDLCTDASCD